MSKESIKPICGNCRFFDQDGLTPEVIGQYEQEISREFGPEQAGRIAAKLHNMRINWAGLRTCSADRMFAYPNVECESRVGLLRRLEFSPKEDL